MIIIKPTARDPSSRHAKCECEAECHFTGSNVHRYEAVKPDVQPFKTPHATLQLCRECREHCLAFYAELPPAHSDSATLRDARELTQLRHILAEAFCKARNLPEPYAPLTIYFRPDELIVIIEGSQAGNVWIMSIGSDDDVFHFVDNDGNELKFPMPVAWLTIAAGE